MTVNPQNNASLSVPRQELVNLRRHQSIALYEVKQEADTDPSSSVLDIDALLFYSRRVG